MQENFFEEFEKSNYEIWKIAAEKSLKGADFDKSLLTKTYEGITLKPIYTLEDFLSIQSKIEEFPGYKSYERHSNIDGYIGRTWYINQYINYPIPKFFNQALLHEIENGQDAINLNFDKAATLYEDFEVDDLSNIDLIAVDLEDIEQALKDIDLKKIYVNLNNGIATFPAFIGCLAYCKKNNIELKELQYSINFDYISDFIKEGNLKISLKSYNDLIYYLAKWHISNNLKVKLIQIDTTVFHNAGANIIQEIAAGLSIGVYLINQLLLRGLEIEQIIELFTFKTPIGVNYFAEIAKLKAIRILWSQILEEYKCRKQSPLMIYAETSQRDSTYYDVNVNLLRSTTEVFSAIVGGANFITVRNYDELHSLPSEFSLRIARNTQNVLKYEAHLTDTIDPAGGSWYLENLTYQFAEEIWKEFSKIESNGGIIEVLKQGTLQNDINLIAEQRIKNAATRKDVIIGTNKYANLKDKQIVNKLDFNYNDIKEFIYNKIKKLEQRNTEEIDELLNSFENAFSNNDFSAIDFGINAILKGATLSELNNSIPTEIDEIVINPLLLKRPAEQYEKLREFSNNYQNLYNYLPTINYLCFGKLKEYKARLDFSTDFFNVGGFDNNIIENLNLIQINLSEIKLKSNIVIICSTDENYQEIIPHIVPELKNRNLYVVLAGMPKDKSEEYKNLGVDLFIHIKANLVDCIKEVQNNYKDLN